MVGWLAQPIEKWPPISNEVAMQGDSHIAERIILRNSGYHEGLSGGAKSIMIRKLILNVYSLVNFSIFFCSNFYARGSSRDPMTH